MRNLHLLLDAHEDSNPWPVIAIAAIVIGVTLFLLFSGLQDGFSVIRQWFFQSGAVQYSSKTIDNTAVHLTMFPYYQKLSPNGKEEFIRRTLNFLNTKTIEGENDYEPDYAAKVHVAAAATQLTFGLKDFSFSHFDDVILYPTIFKLSPNAPLMKGATTADGVIRISMKDFDEGFKYPTNKLNVGLHELGHALFMEFLKEVSDEQSEDETFYVTNIVHPYLVESDKILNSGKDHDNFLRDYAFSNRHEFFAVSVEHFFEASGEFKEKLPQLYKVMVRLLNQDPNNASRDYVAL